MRLILRYVFGLLRWSRAPCWYMSRSKMQNSVPLSLGRYMRLRSFRLWIVSLFLRLTLDHLCCVSTLCRIVCSSWWIRRSLFSSSSVDSGLEMSFDLGYVMNSECGVLLFSRWCFHRISFASRKNATFILVVMCSSIAVARQNLGPFDRSSISCVLIEWVGSVTRSFFCICSSDCESVDAVCELAL